MEAALWRHWPATEPLEATLRDFSIAGCGLDTCAEIAPGEIVLLRANVLTAIGRVRSSWPTDGVDRRRFGVEFLTLETHMTPGEVFSGAA